MSLKRKVVIALIILILGIQFIPTNVNQNTEIQKTDITYVYSVPDTVLRILERSCYDCHSNTTNYPWYNTVQPFGC